MVYLLKMVIFHCYVSLPEGNPQKHHIIYSNPWRIHGAGILYNANNHRGYIDGIHGTP